MPSKKLTADQIRRNIATAKPTAPAKRGKTIGENIKFSLDRVLSVPKTTGTGTAFLG
jgi:hypothetical protein